MRVTRQEWRRRLARWRKSGKSLAEFAESEGINPHTLGWWRWRLGQSKADGRKRRASKPPKKTRASTRPAPQFVELAALSVPDDQRFEVELANGRRVRVPAEFDADGFSRLLGVLERES